MQVALDFNDLYMWEALEYYLNFGQNPGDFMDMHDHDHSDGDDDDEDNEPKSKAPKKKEQKKREPTVEKVERTRDNDEIISYDLQDYVQEEYISDN